ncbi:peptidoglycan-binding protein [Pikeienuella piscinae]|uniref:Peptidoglycan-binding protein n=1 Tax=Pikeienuella piscinae TaxID=2748098 RepID=A0A7L5BSS2_9RHOB|nr:peptidoglycan-binding domain-containing protein [Pikeienuella piscinae]QIE54325.1 peptidoglycan-binding protein [Pikeienuella piscinae]
MRDMLNGAAAAALLFGVLQATGAMAASSGEMLFWRKAQESGAVSDYREYLRRFPAGDFAALARDRIEGGVDTLERQASPSTPEDEEALDLDPAMRAAVQDGLTQRGFTIGASTGEFDTATRNAIRGWQAQNDLPSTGFISAEQYDEITTAPLSGSIPIDEPMTARIDSSTSEAERAAREARLDYGVAELREIEGRLARAGFDPGPIDGVIDPTTRGAIAAYRQARGFAVNGYLDRPVIDALVRETKG